MVDSLGPQVQDSAKKVALVCLDQAIKVPPSRYPHFNSTLYLFSSLIQLFNLLDIELDAASSDFLSECLRTRSLLADHLGRDISTLTAVGKSSTEKFDGNLLLTEVRLCAANIYALRLITPFANLTRPVSFWSSPPCSSKRE